MEAFRAKSQSADSTLSSVTTALQRAISLGVEGANGTLNPADRAAIATEVQGIQSQLVSLANLSYQGSYVFAGTATQTPPYVLDATSPSGVNYVGNSNTNSITLGNHFTLQTNVPGSQLFSAAGSDMFQSIQDLLTGLQSGTGIAAAVGEVTSAVQLHRRAACVLRQRGKPAQRAADLLKQRHHALAQQQNTLGGADMPAVITNLTTAETSRQATLAAVAGATQTNLFSYMK